MESLERVNEEEKNKPYLPPYVGGQKQMHGTPGERNGSWTQLLCLRTAVCEWTPGQCACQTGGWRTRVSHSTTSLSHSKTALSCSTSLSHSTTSLSHSTTVQHSSATVQHPSFVVNGSFLLIKSLGIKPRFTSALMSAYHSNIFFTHVT